MENKNFLLNLDDMLTNDLHSARRMGVGGGNRIISHVAQYLEKRLGLRNNTLPKVYITI